MKTTLHEYDQWDELRLIPETQLEIDWLQTREIVGCKKSTMMDKTRIITIELIKPKTKEE